MSAEEQAGAGDVEVGPAGCRLMQGALAPAERRRLLPRPLQVG
jgi:hypothetical protein